MLIHKPTKEKFENRLEAKQKMGHSNFNRAINNNEFIFINVHDKNDIIY